MVYALCLTVYGYSEENIRKIQEKELGLVILFIHL